MKTKQQTTMKFASNMTVEQESKGGEDMVTEAEAILLYLRCVVEELDSDINKHKVTTPSHINQKVALISELASKYSTAVWNENTDLSKAINLREE